MLSRTGSAMTAFAVTLQVYDLTRSPAAVGGIGVATLVPLLLVTVPGGTLADRVDRRRLVLASTVGQAAVSAVAVRARGLRRRRPCGRSTRSSRPGPRSARSTRRPGRRSSPGSCRGTQLAAAMALNRIIFQVVMIAGPSLAGLAVAWAGLRGCYLADVASFAGALWGVGRLPAMPPEAATAADDSTTGDRAIGESATGDGARPRSALALTLEGLAFIRRTPILCGAFLADVNATFFALPVSLFPAINARAVRRGPADPRPVHRRDRRRRPGQRGFRRAVAARVAARPGHARLRGRVGRRLRAVRGRAVAVADPARPGHRRARGHVHRGGPGHHRAGGDSRPSSAAGSTRPTSSSARAAASSGHSSRAWSGP